MGHTFTNHLYHITFSTHKHEGWLASEIRPRVIAYVMGIVNNLDCTAVRVGAVKDHVHLLLRIPPNLAVSKCVGTVKANSSRWAGEEWPSLHGVGWQAGYASFTVSESVCGRVAAYIDRQAQHHKRYTFAEELAILLRRHGLAFDPDHYLD